jgi:hypothetical protein
MAMKMQITPYPSRNYLKRSKGLRRMKVERVKNDLKVRLRSNQRRVKKLQQRVILEKIHLR